MARDYRAVKIPDLGANVYSRACSTGLRSTCKRPPFSITTVSGRTPAIVTKGV